MRDSNQQLVASEVEDKQKADSSDITNMLLHVAIKQLSTLLLLPNTVVVSTSVLLRLIGSVMV